MSDKEKGCPDGALFFCAGGEGKDFECGVEGDVVDFCEGRFGWNGVENGEKLNKIK